MSNRAVAALLLPFAVAGALYAQPAAPLWRFDTQG